MTRRRHNAFYAKPKGYQGGTSIGVAEYPGFHTADQRDTTLGYAYAKAKVDEFPVIVELDMSGYERLIDYDAAVSLLPVLQMLLQESPTLDDFYDNVESAAGEAQIDYPEGVAELAFQASIGDVLEGGTVDPSVFEDEEDYQTVRQDVLDNVVWGKGIKTGHQLLPRTEQIVMEALGQFRYLDDIPGEKVTRVTLVQPMWPDILRMDDDEKIEELEDLGWAVATEDDVGMWQAPIGWTKVLYEREPGVGARVEFHGTSLPNVLAAAPHLADDLQRKVPEMPKFPEED